jgi:hypothetical protein
MIIDLSQDVGCCDRHPIIVENSFQTLGINLQLMGYVGRFHANIGAGIANLAGGYLDGVATGVSSEFLLSPGSGHFGLLLTGRLFVKEWNRWILLADNAFLYGGLGVRYDF